MSNYPAIKSYYQTVYKLALSRGLNDHAVKTFARQETIKRYPQTAEWFKKRNQDFLGMIGPAAMEARKIWKAQQQQPVQPSLPEPQPEAPIIDEREAALDAWKTLMTYFTDHSYQLNGQRQLTFTALSQLLRQLGQ